MHNAEISMPIAKAGSAIAVAGAAKLEVAADLAHSMLPQTASYKTWVFFMTIPWDTLAAFAAFGYSIILIGEWFWKKFWRPAFERKGWIAPKKGPRIITLEEYHQMSETQRADL